LTRDIGNRWFLRPLPKRAPRLRLICLPYAGGNAGTYVPWSAHLPPDVELIAVQPPGRGTRMDEAPYSEMEPLIQALLTVFPRVTDRPYLLFGHSLGSRIAFELAVRCGQAGLPTPVTFIASGSRAPHLRKREKPIYDLPQPQFIAALRELNGTPEELLENRELLALLNPLLRADFKIADTYCATPVALDCPVVVFTGVEDHEVSREEAERWRDLAARGCEVHGFPGGHFFIEENRAQVLEKLNAVLVKLVCI
jgi:medium-chain acyl-[acyl-carrier-protein] hydrolase